VLVAIGERNAAELWAGKPLQIVIDREQPSRRHAVAWLGGTITIRNLVRSARPTDQNVSTIADEDRTQSSLGEHRRRTVVLLSVEQLLEHSSELVMSPLAESLGDLGLEVFDGGPTGFDEGFALPGQHDELGAPVMRVGLSYDVAQGLELVDELAHGLRAHVRAVGELREPRAGRVDLREHGRVRGLLGNPAPTTPSTMRRPSRLSTWRDAFDPAHQPSIWRGAALQSAEQGQAVTVPSSAAGTLAST
jgi:hypothetical protein